MIVILKDNRTEKDNKELDKLISYIKKQGVEISAVTGTQTTILGLIGDTTKIDIDYLRQYDIVENVQRVAEPYKNVSRKFQPKDSMYEVISSTEGKSGIKIGEGYFSVIAGPCSVESSEQIIFTAQNIKKSHGSMLRGGAFKPRSSPYSFQGLRAEGIEFLIEARKETGLPIVTEIMDLSHLHLFEEVDVIQVGARNMQNFELLKELGKLKKPILLKRGLANTIEEFLMSAEYIMNGGNLNVILCERGIRTFETKTRNTLDISAVPVIKRSSHLPVIVDPSHAGGYSYLVKPLAYAAIAAGADGLMIEVHNDPQNALSDGAQSLNCEEFTELMANIEKRVEFEGKVYQY